MGTACEIILALAIIALLLGVMYAVIAWECKRSFMKLEIGDQYLIVSRRNPRNHVILTITDLDSNNGTVSYNLRKTKSDAECYGEKTVGYKYFFLTSIQANNATYVEYLGNITSHWKNY